MAKELADILDEIANQLVAEKETLVREFFRRYPQVNPIRVVLCYQTTEKGIRIWIELKPEGETSGAAP